MAESQPTVAGSNLPAEVDVQDAPLPEKYEQARAYLAECERVDECKDWGDKARALASYARQAEDDELYLMARRIQGRAVRRAGELLREFRADTEKNLVQHRGDGAGTSGNGRPQTQREAAERAGMSKRQEVTARRVAEVPEEEFEEAIESDDPPSVTELAERGRGADYLAEEKPEGFQAATSLLGRLRRFAEFCNENAPEVVAGAMSDQEIETVARHGGTTAEWLRSLLTELGETDA